jgi:ParB family chromosome partitioning protein
MAKYKLQEISPNDVKFSTQNPRGESPKEIQSDKSFEQLKDSVAQFGVLVPIVVHIAEKDVGKKYILVDGERRLRAALDANVEEIPAHIATSEDRMGELVQAFHIHMLRKQWKPVAIALAFRRIRRELKKKKKWKSDRELLRELQAMTGCTNKQLEDLQRTVHYPAGVLEDVTAGKMLWSHLVQFEASFVEQLEQHYSGLLKKLGKQEVRRVLIEKAQQKVIETTRDLMTKIVPIVQRAKTSEQKKFVESLFEKFITDINISPEFVKRTYDKTFPPSKDQLELAKEIMTNCDLLNSMIEQIETSQIIRE